MFWRMCVGRLCRHTRVTRRVSDPMLRLIPATPEANFSVDSPRVPSDRGQNNVCIKYANFIFLSKTHRNANKKRPSLTRNPKFRFFSPNTHGRGWQRPTVNSHREGVEKIYICCLLLDVVKFGIFRFLDFHFPSRKHIEMLTKNDPP